MKTKNTILMTAVAALLAAGLHSAPASADKVIMTPNGTYVRSHHVVQVMPARVAYVGRVSMRSARASALARNPGMKLRSETFTRIGGRPVYVFTLFNARQRGLTQVTVDARSGNVIGVQHLGRY